MLEKVLYTAALAGLTDEEFVEVVGSAIKARKLQGIVVLLGLKGCRTLSAGSFHEDTGMCELPLAAQLRTLSMYCSYAETETIREVIEEDLGQHGD